ncbi:MAG: thioredoxin-dependent thiol peroxidase [candidate division WWE3 bacterium]|nr:thioredoxin-dependent thiol peroxidase [candidate division WWE3 bacterium]
MLSINTKAPQFSASDQTGTVRNLSDYLGKWVVLYFYPKDDTPGCTKEACSLQDSYTELEKLGAVIIGVSKDSIASHQKFAAKYHLKFPLLADETKEIINKYEAWGSKKFMGKEYEGTLRITYLIDTTGVIRKAYLKVNPLTHVSEIIIDLKSLL